MAITLSDGAQSAQLQNAVRTNWEEQAGQRDKRRRLIDIYADRGAFPWRTSTDYDRDDVLVNYFQQYVRGHLLSVAYQTPRWSVKARTMNGRGFDERCTNFLNRYTQLLELHRVGRQLAVDSAFGNAICKIITSIAPKGVTAPVAPRAYRVNPDHLILDQSAAVPEESTFFADVYLVPLREARNHPGFSERRARLSAWGETAPDSEMIPRGTDSDVLAEEMTRLIDVYLPTRGESYTWEAHTDMFSEIGTEPPLQTLRPSVNPYEIVQLTPVPDRLEELARLNTLKGLHLAANDMLIKGLRQAKKSQRNPVDKIGNEQELHSLLSAGDNEPVFLNDPETLDLYTIPGPDPSIIQLSQIFGGLFSQQAGNLEVALGQSAGATTARQTQAILGQLTAAQALDRDQFEFFMSNIGRKLLSYAFHDEYLELDAVQRVPGTNYYYNAGWAPPDRLPRPGFVDDFTVEVVKFSSSYRSPQERLAQLDAASKSIMQWMAIAAQGAPVNLAAIIKSHQEAFDLVPDLTEWWSGEKPSPQERTASTYTSTAGPSEGSTVSYEGGLGGGGGGPEFGGAEAVQGGLSGGGV
jgi:hypothetical protein